MTVRGWRSTTTTGAGRPTTTTGDADPDAGVDADARLDGDAGVHDRRRRTLDDDGGLGAGDDDGACVDERLVDGVDARVARPRVVIDLREVSVVEVDAALQLERRRDRDRRRQRVVVRAVDVAVLDVAALVLQRMRAVIGMLRTLVAVGDRVADERVAAVMVPVEHVGPLGLEDVHVREVDLAVAAADLGRDRVRAFVPDLMSLGLGDDAEDEGEYREPVQDAHGRPQSKRLATSNY